MENKLNKPKIYLCCKNHKKLIKFDKKPFTSSTRGHKIIWLNDKWFYEDTGESTDIERPCIKCGRKATPEGYDACLGKLEGVINACCGHGVEKGSIQYEGEETPGFTVVYDFTDLRLKKNKE